MRRRAAAILITLFSTGTAIELGVASSAAARSKCRTVVVNADVSGSASVKLRRCWQLKVVFEFGTQGEFVPDWEVDRKPSARVLKLLGKSWGQADPSGDTAQQTFSYRAVGKGRTSIKFGEYTPSYPGVELDSFKVSATVS